MAIPIQNIYYLLSYAWQLLEEGEEQDVTAVPADNLLNLVTALLLKNTRRLLRQGLAQSYYRRTDTLGILKGKIDLTHSFKTDLLRQGKAVCTFEDLSNDILPNQIIKATLHRLLATPALAPDLLLSLRPLYRQLEPVTTLELTAVLFGQLPARLPNNYSAKYYARVLPLCQCFTKICCLNPEMRLFYSRIFRKMKNKWGVCLSCLCVIS